MADTFIQLPSDGDGKRVRAFSSVVGGQTVHHQAQVPVDVAGNAVGTYSEAFDEVSSTLIYSGLAASSSSTAAAVWRIKKTQITGTVTRTTWAGGNTNFEHVWDNRASLIYS